MAYINTEDLRAGMVVARKLRGQNQRVLLQAGVALSETHIHALRSLDISGLEIRSGSYTRTLAPRCQDSVSTTIPADAPSPDEQSDLDRSSSASSSSHTAVETLRVTRTTSRPLMPVLKPLIARQTNAILNELLKGTRIKTDSALAEVIKLCTVRILQAKGRQKTGVNMT